MSTSRCSVTDGDYLQRKSTSSDCSSQTSPANSDGQRTSGPSHVWGKEKSPLNYIETWTSPSCSDEIVEETEETSSVCADQVEPDNVNQVPNACQSASCVGEKDHDNA